MKVSASSMNQHNSVCANAANPLAYLQAVCACLIQPCILLSSPSFTGEGGGVSDLSTDVVKNRQQHTVKDAQPEAVSKAATMGLQHIKQHLQEPKHRVDTITTVTSAAMVWNLVWMSL